MKKLILVIDLPEDFDYKRCSIGGDGNIYYEREGEQRTSIIGNIKNLKPTPEKMEVDVEKIEDIMHTEIQMVDVIQDKIKAKIKLDTDKLIALGWNACIEELTK